MAITKVRVKSMVYGRILRLTVVQENGKEQLQHRQRLRIIRAGDTGR